MIIIRDFENIKLLFFFCLRCVKDIIIDDLKLYKFDDIKHCDYYTKITKNAVLFIICNFCNVIVNKYKYLILFTTNGFYFFLT